MGCSCSPMLIRFTHWSVDCRPVREKTMTNSRRMTLASLASVALLAASLLAACGGGEEGQDSAQTSDELVLDLQSQGEFKAPGLRVTLDAEGASRTRVMVDGLDEGEPAGVARTPLMFTVGRAKSQSPRRRT